VTQRNWAGNVSYSSSRVAEPVSVEDLTALVASEPRVRALGSRHCFNDIADTPGVHVSLARLRGEEPRLTAPGTLRTPATASACSLTGRIRPSCHRCG
jgi:xylitol oxidase